MASATGAPSAVGSGVFSADNLRKRMAEREAARAAEQFEHMRELQQKQAAIVEEFNKPPARTADQIMELVQQMVSRAADRGESEVEVYKFPSKVCTDHGRAINNFEADWPKSLSGRPQLLYEFWKERLEPLGLGLKATIVDYPGGFPGDVALLLTW
jgi:hypothetical protein